MSCDSELIDHRDRVGYDPTTETYYSHHEIEDADRICLAVVETVSAATGREATDMEPLYSVLDPDALEAILTTPDDGVVRVFFEFEGCAVTTSSTGQVIVGSKRAE